jgi:membrane associated rhomboid family serine protease
VSSATTEPRPQTHRALARQSRQEGIRLLLAIVALMWVVEVINSLDANRLDRDGIWPRNVGHLWGILTAPFLHASFGHLLSNTVPLLFMGVIIALRGAARVGAVTLIVIVIGGLGTWLTAPSGTVTIGASGLVFGYAAYLLARGFFDRSLRQLLIGAVVLVLWGGVLLVSFLPEPGVSWQGHLFGAVGGVVAAWWLSERRVRRDSGVPRRQGARALAK